LKIFNFLKTGFLKWVMSLSLQIRIILLYSVFTILLIILVSEISFNITLSLIKEKEKSILEDSMVYVNDRINLKVEAINKRFLDIFSETQFIDLYFQINEEETVGYRQVDSDFLGFFKNIVIQNQDILNSIVMVTESGELFCSEHIPSSKYDDISEKDYYTRAMENKNIIVYTASDEGIAISKSFYFQEGTHGDRVGYKTDDDSMYSVLVFFLRKQYFEKILDNIPKRRNIAMYIVDRNGYVIVDSKTGGYSESECSNILKSIDRAGSGSSEIRSDGRNLVINQNSLYTACWQLVSVYDQSILNKDANSISRKIIMVLLVSFVAVILIANFISNSVTKPLRKLTRLMNRAEENNLDISYNIKYNDEIADLCRTFNSMMKRINELVLRIQKEEKLKREEELKALQAQINPHFLYNTLDTIYWLAKMEKKDEIAELVGDLGGFFRLSLNNGNEITTLWNEVEHVKKYLSIQKVRYKDKFNYSIHIDENLYKARIPKLILQPIVENSLVHGFKSINYKGMIEISANACGENTVIKIRDNGRGLERDIMEKLRSGGTASDNTGYALNNVMERIKLHVGTQYGMEICSTHGESTTVTITLPLSQ